jgi:alanine racemase
VKVDTGLSRNGATLADLPHLLDRVRSAAAEGTVELVGLWTHFADADVPGSASAAAQRERFDEALRVAKRCPLDVPIRHLSNSGGLWAHPELRADLVRVGIALYGLTPADGLGSAGDLGLTPAMTLRAGLAGVKAVAAGTSVSYAGIWTAPAPTRLGLVPVGYADGIPRSASGLVEVLVAGRRRPAVGRVAMDQFVVDLADGDVEAGDEVVIFGPGGQGEPTADEWARRIGTIGYEIVTRIGPRVPRVHVGASPMSSATLAAPPGDVRGSA